MSIKTRPADEQTKKQANAQASTLITGHFIVGIVLALLFAFVFARIWDAVKDKGHDTTQFDDSILLWMDAHHTPWITSVAKALAFVGSPPLMVGLAALSALVGLAWHKVRGAAWTLPIAVVGAGLIIQGIKVVFHRPRPTLFTPLVKESGFSFPSGHSLIAMVVYGLIGYFIMHLVKSRAARIAVAVITALIVLSIGVSRVYVGVHNPTDVLAGWTIGVPWLITCMGLHEVLSRRFAKAGEPVLDKPPAASAAAARATDPKH